MTNKELLERIEQVRAGMWMPVGQSCVGYDMEATMKIVADLLQELATRNEPEPKANDSGILNRVQFVTKAPNCEPEVVQHMVHDLQGVYVNGRRMVPWQESAQPEAGEAHRLVMEMVAALLTEDSDRAKQTTEAMTNYYIDHGGKLERHKETGR